MAGPIYGECEGEIARKVGAMVSIRKSVKAIIAKISEKIRGGQGMEPKSCDYADSLDQLGARLALAHLVSLLTDAYNRALEGDIDKEDYVAYFETIVNNAAPKLRAVFEDSGKSQMDDLLLTMKQLTVEVERDLKSDLFEHLRWEALALIAALFFLIGEPKELVKAWCMAHKTNVELMVIGDVLPIAGGW